MAPHPARVLPFDQLMAGLREAVGARLVTERTSGDLCIYNYTPICVYERQWNSITLLARGLVVDAVRGRVLATPFPKFFNLGEHPDEDAALLGQPFTVHEKLDGSLIIIFHDGERWRTATRGSFESAQATAAQIWLDVHDIRALTPGYTYLAEWVGPSNKIVVPYERDELILLAAYDGVGYECDRPTVWETAINLGCRDAGRYRFDTLTQLVERAADLPAHDEGFVVRFANGRRVKVKVKGEQYRRLHALISRVTPLAVWEAMAAGDDPILIRDQLPDEFHRDLDQIQGALDARIAEITIQTAAEAERTATWTDKEVGLALDAIPEPARRFIFAWRKNGGDLMSGRARDALFRAIRPTGNVLPGYMPSTGMNRVTSAEEI